MRRAPARIICSALALATLGCHSIVSLDRPPNNGASTVLIIATADRAVAVRAVDATHPDWSPLGAREGDTIYALSFSCGVERLGLLPGTQALAQVRATGARVPPQAAMFERIVGADDAEEWRRGSRSAIDRLLSDE